MGDSRPPCPVICSFCSFFAALRSHAAAWRRSNDCSHRRKRRDHRPDEIHLAKKRRSSRWGCLLEGNVRLSLPGQGPSDPLRGEQLTPGTILDTGSGKVLLLLSDGSEVLLRPHTRLQLQQPSLADPSYFQLLLGRIRALVNKRTGGAIPFELGTPSAVIHSSRHALRRRS